MKYTLLILSLTIQLSLVGNDQADQHHPWDGATYDKNSTSQYRIGVKAVESFNLRGNERVLDVGCGNGKITALCAQKVPAGSLTAIDISPSMIEFARKNYGDAANITFVTQDVTTMSFDQEFDFVYSIFCLHWVKDHERAIQTIAKSLKPGGKAVLYIGLPNAFGDVFQDEYNKLIHVDPWYYYKHVKFIPFVIPKEMWCEYAQRNGFEITNVETFQDNTVYDYPAFKQKYTAYGLGCEIRQAMGEDLGKVFLDIFLENVCHALGLTAGQPVTWRLDAVILTLTKK